MPLDHEDLEDLVRRVISEERSESLAHPTHRERVTRYTDGDGQTWVSMTLKKGEVAQKLAALVIALTTLFGAVNYFITRLVVYPAIETRIALYQKEAAARMETIRPQLMPRSEFDRWAADKEARWRNQEASNAEVGKALDEIRSDIKELLRRR